MLSDASEALAGTEVEPGLPKSSSEAEAAEAAAAAASELSLVPGQTNLGYRNFMS